MPQGFTESPYFSKHFKSDLDKIKISGGSTLFQYADNLLLCSLSQASLQGSIHVLKLLALKEHKSIQGKICSN